MRSDMIKMLIACFLAAGVLSGACAQNESKREDAEYFNDKAVEFLKYNNVEGAYGCLIKALQADPTFASVHANLGLVYKRKGELDKALEHLHKALQINPDLREAYSTIVSVYNEKGDFRSAAEYSEKALALKVDDARSEYNLGFSYLLDDDKGSALEQYRKLKEMGEAGYAGRLLEKIKRLWPDVRVENLTQPAALNATK